MVKANYSNGFKGVYRPRLAAKVKAAYGSMRTAALHTGG